MYESLGTSYMEVFCEMYCQKLQKKAPISESFFNKVLTFNFIKKWLQYRCLPMIFLTFFRTTNLENLRTIISEVSKIDGVFKTYISSHRRCSIKKSVLKNFAIFTGKHLCWNACIFIKNRLKCGCFPVNVENY